MRHELESGVGKDKNNLGLGAEGEEQRLRTNVTYGQTDSIGRYGSGYGCGYGPAGD